MQRPYQRAALKVYDIETSKQKTLTGSHITGLRREPHYAARAAEMCRLFDAGAPVEQMFSV